MPVLHRPRLVPRQMRRYPRLGFVGSKLVLPTVAGLRVWYDAADLATITDAGSGHVSQWLDKSGSGFTLVMATDAQRPITGTRTMNGRNALDFDGTDDRMSSAGLTQAQPCTVFHAAQSDVATGSHQTVGNGAVGATPTLYLRGSSTSWAMYAAVELHAVVADTNRHVQCGVFNGASSVLYLDGVQIATGNAGASGWSGGGLIIGCDYTAGSFWNGVIGEILIYTGVLSTTDRQKIEAYLRARWATP